MLKWNEWKYLIIRPDNSQRGDEITERGWAWHVECYKGGHGKHLRLKKKTKIEHTSDLKWLLISFFPQKEVQLSEEERCVRVKRSMLPGTFLVSTGRAVSVWPRERDAGRSPPPPGTAPVRWGPGRPGWGRATAHLWWLRKNTQSW